MNSSGQFVVLQSASVIYSFAHVLVLFMLLYKSRYGKRATFIATGIFTVLWLGLHGVILVKFGSLFLGQAIIVTGTLTSFIFFFVMSKYRDGRFVFVFCFCDTVSAEIILLTHLIDYYLFGNLYIGLFIIRLIAFPLVELFAYRKMKRILNEVQDSVRRGWWIFAIVTVIFYIAMLLISVFPKELANRPDDIPLGIILMVLMPLMYYNIFSILIRQKKIYEVSERDHILRMQVSSMQERIKDFTQADDGFRIERHDMRHKLRTVTELLRDDKVDEAKELLMSAEDKLDASQVKHWCSNASLDAVLVAYLRRAEQASIKVRADISVSDLSNIDVGELSAVFANAIENATNANEKLPPSQRYIDIRVISYPCFMLQIENPYTGEITFNKQGVPTNSADGHGYGTRSIMAFCEKWNAFCEFRASNGKFVLRIVSHS